MSKQIIFIIVLSAVLLCNGCSQKGKNEKVNSPRYDFNIEEDNYEHIDFKKLDSGKRSISNTAEERDEISKDIREEYILQIKENAKKYEKDVNGVLYIYPEVSEWSNISEDEIEKWDKYNYILKKHLKEDSTYISSEIIEKELNEEERNIYYFCSDYKSLWDVSPRCGWYCGGWVNEIYASSYLEAEGNIDYEVKNIHDFDTSTVWVEGVEGYGIGEKVEYYINDFELPTGINIYNGYAKSKELYYKNSRVKELVLYINDEKYCVLCMEDTWKAQNFNIINNELEIEGTNKLSFEILSVYEGEEYKDTCIAEIMMSGKH